MRVSVYVRSTCSVCAQCLAGPHLATSCKFAGIRQRFTISSFTYFEIPSSAASRSGVRARLSSRTRLVHGRVLGRSSPSAATAATPGHLPDFRAAHWHQPPDCSLGAARLQYQFSFFFLEVHRPAWRANGIDWQCSTDVNVRSTRFEHPNSQIGKICRQI